MRLFVFLAAAAALSACASPYVATPYESDLHPVRTIGLIEDVGEADVIAYEVASAGANFGLIGALVDAGVQNSRRARVEETLEYEGFDAQEYVREQLVLELEARGYEVSVVRVGGRDGLQLLDRFDGLDAEVDAHLDAVLQTYGLLSSGAGTPFRPHAQAEAQLIYGDQREIAMRNSVIFTPFGEPAGRILLSPPLDETYRNREEILEDPVRLVESIQLAIRESAAALAAQLDS